MKERGGVNAMRARCKKDQNVTGEMVQSRTISVSGGRTQFVEQKMISKLSAKKKSGKKWFWRWKQLIVCEETLS